MAEALPDFNVNKTAYMEYGTSMLTTAVFAIVITAPLGAILTNTLGPMWLSSDIGEEVFEEDLEIEFKKYLEQACKN